MKEKNNILLMVIAVVALVATVGGAAYAYFASSITPGSGLNLDVTAEASTARLFTTTGGNLSFTVTGAEMQQSDVGKWAGITSGYLGVIFTSESSQNITCTYDIKFAWDEGSGYTPTNGRENQFEFGIKAFNVAPNPDALVNATTGTILVSSNTNFDKITGTTSSGGLDGYIVKGATISANSEVSGATKWDFTITMYNLSHDQSSLAGNGTKTYSGRFYVDNVVC